MERLKNFFGVLQRIGKSLMLPIALLPAAGILMGIGTLFENPDIIARFPIIANENIQMISNIMSSSGEIIFENLSLLFAVGVAIGMCNGDGVSALAAIVGFQTMNMTAGIALGINRVTIAHNPLYTTILGVPTIQTGVFGGILIGLISGKVYKKFYDKRLPEFLGFFSGKRLVPIISAIMGVFLGLLMAIIWPPIQDRILSFTTTVISANSSVAAFIFGLVERALIPFGLHHIWYTPFWYHFGEYLSLSGELIIGDQQIFFAQLRDGVEFTAGAFMTGKYPFMMFGLPAAALAMYHEAYEENKKKVMGILFSAALTSFLTGITEPVEFMFLFVAPALFAVHCVFAGLSFMIMDILNVRIGLTFSGGLIDFILFGILPNRTKWWLAIAVGLIFAVIYYFGFRYIIRKLDLKIAGREREEEQLEFELADGELAKEVLEALGGKKNVKYLDACITRIRITVYEINLVDKDKLKYAMGSELMIIGNNIQAIFGTNSDILKEHIQALIEGREIEIKKKKKLAPIRAGIRTDNVIMIPISGKLLRIEEVPDEIFSMKLIGDGFAINPVDNILLSPIDGKITNISKTNHTINIEGDNCEVFIHIGIDTMKLYGEGFKRLVEEGETVKQGDALIEFSIEKVKEKAKSPIIPIILKKIDQDKFVYFKEGIDVMAGEVDKVQIHENTL
ncbi:glucose-specific PTS transporter subunit IIBC [Clostridium isatidis]|uniref:PTS glucose transporter subunit IICBA n=1 Tax=Clostridium isatidis TaxID=182773 RepID=A0A343JES0_9CLOT|nr:glucose-specific PTS transporter subunit IIBC [Clostridium isatidis]ASW44028.1 PTS glucose transporter subunit IICBA [Clostridium isatidis]